MSDIVKVNDALNAKQYKALELYVSGKEQKEICDKVGITSTTLRKWLATNPNFKSAIKQYLSAYLTANNTRVGAMYEKSIDKLNTLLNDETLTPMNMLKVINTIIKLTKGAVDMEIDNVETEVTLTQETVKDENNKVLSITEQKNILKKIRGNGSSQILEGEGIKS